MHRLLSLMLSVLICSFLFLVSAQVGASEQAEKIQPTENPYLWRIEGEIPSYLLAHSLTRSTGDHPARG